MKDVVRFEVEGELPVFVEIETAGEARPVERPSRRRDWSDSDDPIEKREDGTEIEGEQDDDLPGPIYRRGPHAGETISEDALTDSAGRTGRRWRRALEQVRPAVEDMIEVFQAVATPEEVAVEFCLKFNSRVNAFVFSSDGEATFKVALKWSNQAGGGAGRSGPSGGGGA